MIAYRLENDRFIHDFAYWLVFLEQNEYQACINIQFGYVGRCENMASRPKVTDWTEDEVKSTLLKGWARNGLTNEQIAANMGISKVTFYEWRNKFPNFANLIKEDKDYADTQVENALYKQALEGNVTAAIFWLKNRRRNNWKDKQDVEVSGEIGIAADVIRRARERKERMENEP